MVDGVAYRCVASDMRVDVDGDQLWFRASSFDGSGSFVNFVMPFESAEAFATRVLLLVAGWRARDV